MKLGPSSSHLDGELLYIYPSGRILWSRQGRLTLRCNMLAAAGTQTFCIGLRAPSWESAELRDRHFGRLPYDDQNCLFLVGLWSETANDVMLTWKDLRTPLGASLESFISVGGEWHVNQISATNLLDAYPAGSYSYAKACITLRRKSARNRRRLILACIFVMIAYCGFWISPAAAPGRIALGVITVLIVINNTNSVQSELPKVPYSVWLMEFLFGCAVFNIAAFVSCARAANTPTRHLCADAGCPSCALRPTSPTPSMVDALTNFGMKVDGELAEIKKQGTWNDENRNKYVVDSR